ncbi:MAG: DUF4350 domain-containing protein [Actinomycetota bacterium]
MTAIEDVPRIGVIRTRGRGRAFLGWLVVAALVVAVALIAGNVVATSPAARGGLDPEGANGPGALALAEILRDQGVDVDVVRSRADAHAALRDDSILALSDPYALSDEAVGELLEPSHSTVFLSTSTRLLRLLEMGTATSAMTNTADATACGLTELSEVGEIRPGRLFTPAEGVTGCFSDSSGNAALLVDDRGGMRTAMIDGTGLFSNEFLAEDGNAALGIALLGQTGHVVWYVPSFQDSDIEGTTPDTLATFTPEWVTPAILLVLLAGITVILWRGRRFGPLVAETLPVTVRASETMHGRARLTAKAADAAHAAAALREGTLRRLARRLGLHARSRTEEIADATADRLRIPRADVRGLLLGPLPDSDTDLVDTARRLSDLEAAVDAAAPHERNTP